MLNYCDEFEKVHRIPHKRCSYEEYDREDRLFSATIEQWERDGEYDLDYTEVRPMAEKIIVTHGEARTMVAAQKIALKKAQDRGLLNYGITSALGTGVGWHFIFVKAR